MLANYSNTTLDLLVISFVHSGVVASLGVMADINGQENAVSWQSHKADFPHLDSELLHLLAWLAWRLLITVLYSTCVVAT